MQKEIKEHQDKMVKFVIKAKKLQNESGFKILLSMNEFASTPVDLLLESLLRATTRTNLKEKIKKALNNNNKE